jgi:hypothetical protein
MAKDKEHLEDLSAIAAQTMEKTREAMDNYFNFLQKTVSSNPWTRTELGEKLKSIAGQNIAATHEYVHKLSQARDLQDAIQIQTEFIRTQMSSFADQVKDLGELYFKAAASVMKTSFNSSS